MAAGNTQIQTHRQQRLKVVCITCYRDPDYIRSRTVRAGLAANPQVELIVIKNTERGAGRYVEVLRQVAAAKAKHRPDVYVVNFRGYEILPFVLMLAGGKPVIYDEFINPVLVVEEHRRQKQGVVKMLMGMWSVFGGLYYGLARHADRILTDTAAHGEYSARHGNLSADKYKAIPVGTDETVFFPKPGKRPGKFQVFFYSTGSQPLHGVPAILQAAVELSNRPDIEFLIAGNKGGLAGKVAAAVTEGAHIQHKAWIDFEDLPDVIRASGVCLGGPFGGTPQAQLVVTGKTYQFLACQAAVIVGQSLATSDFINKQNSLVVPQDDPAALAKAIAWVADHPKERQAIALAGRHLYEEKFSSQVIADELDGVISALPPRVAS